MPRLSMPNRRIRGRMYGGVGGEVSNGLPYPMSPPDLHPYGLCNRLMRCNLPSDDSTLLNVSATPALGVGCKNLPLRLQIANLYLT